MLLGYEVKDNRRQTTAERLRRYRTEKDRAGLAEAEKALQKYPNDFEIVYRSAGLYRVFGIVERDEALLRRALALLDKARLLLPQNTNPQINETVLSGQGECIDAGVSGRCAEKQRGAGRSRRFSAAGAGARRAV